MKRTWTIIGVADVARSFKWYQSLFGQPETPPAHDASGKSSTRMERSCFVFISGVHTSIHPWPVLTARSLATDYFYSFVWMILTRC